MDIYNVLNALPTPENETEWYNVIKRFKNKANEFGVLYNTVVNATINQSKYPTIAREQQELIRRGNIIKSSIEKVTKTVDETWSWLKSQIGLDGLTTLSNEPGLGVVPLIPIAVIGGSLALMGKWIFDSKKFVGKIEEVKRLERKGYSSEQAVNMVEKLLGEKSLINLGKIMPIILIVGIGALIIKGKK